MHPHGFAAAYLMIAATLVAARSIPGAPKIFGIGPLPGLEKRQLPPVPLPPNAVPDGTAPMPKERDAFPPGPVPPWGFGGGHPPVTKAAEREAFPPGPVPPGGLGHPPFKSMLNERQNTNGQCGAGFGSCADGYCCSPAGYCGVTEDYCESPDCQIDYGTGCDGLKTPPGSSTATIVRPIIGSVPYGGNGIYECTVPGTIALTFDDGPYIYTTDVLDILASYNAPATFYVVGINSGKGEIDDTSLPWSAIIQRMNAEGHQIASHTWSHQDLSLITPAQRQDQMIKNEVAMRNILGFFPTYMRPPYSSCTAASGCEDDLGALGYHITYFDIDTDDYDNDSPLLIPNAKNNFDNGLAGGSPTSSDFLVIAHDIHEQTAHNLTAYMLQRIQALGYKPVTVGECLGDPKENWYRSASAVETTSSTTSAGTMSSVASSTGSKPVSADDTCGAAFTCQGSTFRNCCSQYGYCGSTTDYCTTGCQSSAGTCSANPLSTTTVASGTSVGSSTASTAEEVSTDGSCGAGATQFTCQGSTFGNCCSQYGWCGSTSDYCTTGC